MAKTTKKTVEDALREIEEITRVLERGEADLETSLKLYEQGTRLIASCRKELSAAQLRIDELSAEEPAAQEGQ